MAMRHNVRPAMPGQRHSRRRLLTEAPSAAPWTPRWVLGRDHGEATVIALHGDVDIQLAPALDEQVTAALRAGMHVVLDLTEVSLIDCACLGVLVKARRQADRRHRVLTLAAPAPLVQRTLHVTLLDAEFSTFPTVRQALAWLRARITDASGRTAYE
jgi:anti-sigma B factor antagonist